MCNLLVSPLQIFKFFYFSLGIILNFMWNVLFVVVFRSVLIMILLLLRRLRFLSIPHNLDFCSSVIEFPDQIFNGLFGIPIIMMSANGTF